MYGAHNFKYPKKLGNASCYIRVLADPYHTRGHNRVLYPHGHELPRALILLWGRWPIDTVRETISLLFVVFRSVFVLKLSFLLLQYEIKRNLALSANVSYTGLKADISAG